MKTKEWQPDSEGHREESGPKGNADLEQHGYSLAGMCMVEGRGQGGETQWGLDLNQMLPDPAGRPRRNPLAAVSGNPGLKVFPWPPGQGAQSSDKGHSPTSLPRKETLHNETWLTY